MKNPIPNEILIMENSIGDIVIFYLLYMKDSKTYIIINILSNLRKNIIKVFVDHVDICNHRDPI